MRDVILKVLKSADDYVSGEKLSNQLGVSRTAVWKNIAALKKDGYEIKSVTNKGYKLVNTPDNLTEQEIMSELNDISICKKLINYDVIDSTITEAKRIILEGIDHGTVLVAERQTKGKGRRGRVWDSQKGTGIWTSFILRPDIPPNKASMLTLVAGIATCHAIRKTTGLEAYIKWPNDIVINKKKVSGILTEMSAQIEQLNYIILGIGINVNIESFPDEIKDRATSIKLELGKDCSRRDIFKQLIIELDKYYKLFLETEDLTKIIDEYKHMCINMNQMVKVIERGNILEGKVIDINCDGEIILQDTLLETHIIRSGEVSVRGMYGYV